MAGTAERGTLWLTLAQAYHAFTGYFIFVNVARALGQEGYADFGLVLWTMTTLEIFVVDGVPKAVSYFTARLPGSSRALLRAGLRSTTVAALLLAGLLVVCAPLLAAHWRNDGLVTALRLSSLDFITFVAFAVVIQVLNGLHDFRRQAMIWFHYSTWKTVCVTAVVHYGGGIEGAALGYATASLLGSAGAVAIGLRAARLGNAGAAPGTAELARFGFPVATQSIALLALVNVDLWAAGHTDAPRLQKGAYTGAATLARAVFFIFRAFGDALFPAVARHLAEGRRDEAVRSARKGLSLLLCLILPAIGLATGSAGTVLVVLFGDPAYVEGAGYLRVLAPAAGGWALAAVLAALVSATARPWRMAAFLLALLLVDTGLVYFLAGRTGQEGAAAGALATSVLALAATASLAVHALGNILPLAAIAASGAACAGIHLALSAWCPDSWLVFPWGALLYVVGAGSALAVTRVARRR